MRLVGHSRRCCRSGEMPYLQKRRQSSKAEGLRQFAPSLSAPFKGGLQNRMDHRPENSRATSNRSFLQKHREFAVSISDLESKFPLIFTRCRPTGGPGWVAIFETLLIQLQARANGGGVQARVHTAREKWGRLTLRFSPLDPADAAIVAHTESLSLQTCEVCGAPGKLIQEAWHRTRCESHTDFRPNWPTSAR